MGIMDWIRDHITIVHSNQDENRIAEYSLTKPVQNMSVSDDLYTQLQDERTECKTLRTLALTGDTYWKFSQSDPAKHTSAEPVFAKYQPGQITVAQDSDLGLSFVSSSDIGRCYMYGDQLTKFKFDLQDPAFLEIADEPIVFTGNGFGEIKAQKLLTEANYSLNDIHTIQKIVEMSDDRSLLTFLHGNNGGMDLHFSNMGFDETAYLMKYIYQTFDYASVNDMDFIHYHFDDVLEGFYKMLVEHNSLHPWLFEQSTSFLTQPSLDELFQENEL